MSRKNKPEDVFKHINMHDGDVNVCWEWKRKLNKKDGRPYFTVEGVKRPAYTFVLKLAKRMPPEELQNPIARHSCDNPICCNPHHLDWGSHQDNMNDMKERDRHGLPRTVVRAIRKLLMEGRTHISVSELYGISRETVTAIANNRSHKGKE